MTTAAAAIFATPADAFGATNTKWGSSRYGAYQRCHQEHHLRHVLQLVPQRLEVDYSEDPEPMGRPDGLYFEVGQCIHAAIAWVSDGAMHSITARSWRDVLPAAQLAHPEWDLGSIYEAERLLGAYFAHYGEENAGWPEDAEILGVEEYLENGRLCLHCYGTGWLPFDNASVTLGARRAQLSCGFCRGKGVIDGAFALPYTTRADAIIRLNGEIVIPDHKSRAMKIPGTTYPKVGLGVDIDPFVRGRYVQGLATRPQFLGMSWLVMRKYGLQDPPPVWVNAIIKTKIPRFDRVMVRFAREQVEAWAGQQAALAATGLSDRSMNFTQCAPEIGTRCRYFDWCHGSPEIRARKFRTEDAQGSKEND